jgi:hypothetical protein
MLLGGEDMRRRRRSVLRRLGGNQIFVLVPSKLLSVVGGLVAAALVSQIVLGWVLGVTDAWLAVLMAAALLAVLVSADARLGGPSNAADEPYDLVVCAMVGLAIVAAVGCLYLPLPWGGLAAAAVVVGLVVALRVSRDRS